ncbi:MAG: TonB-dependent receptor [candidate division WOR-3 bacterium]|nr:MAG: TonB-dependent receptor [candidate division WOR-3 bacterium]
MKKLLLLSAIVMLAGSQGIEDLLFEEIPVVFAASKFEQPLIEAPASVIIITAQEIERYGYTTLDQALEGVTGLYVTYDRAYKYLGVRGYYTPGDYNSRVLQLVDGMSYNEAVYGAASIGTLFGVDMSDVQRIEIVKGPGSALYGTNALFAVINIVTKSGETINGARASGQYGSYESKQGFFGFGSKQGDIDFLLSGSYTDAPGQDLYFEEYDGYEDEMGTIHDGTAVNCDALNVRNVHAKIAYKTLTLQGTYNRREKNDPTAVYWTIFNDSDTKNVDEHGFVELKFAPNIDETKDVMARAYYSRYDYYGYWAYYYPEEDYFYKELSRDYAKSEFYGSELQFNYRIMDMDRLTVGGEFQHHMTLQQLWDEGLEGDDYYYLYLDDERIFDIWSLYAQNVFEIARMSFVLGVRYDNYHTFGGTTNPRVGWVYNPFENTAIKVLYGTAFRAPSPYEMYYHDGYYSMLANEDLEPERLTTAEFVLEQGFGRHLKGSVSLYRTDVKDLIYQVLTEDDLLQFQNVGEAEAMGVEVNLNANYKGILARAGVNYQESQNVTDDTELVNSPKYSGNIGVSIPVLAEKVFFTVESRYVGERLDVWLEPVDPYLSTNVILFAKDLIPHVELTAKVLNVLDEEYYDPCSSEHEQSSIMQDGRTFHVKLTLKI